MTVTVSQFRTNFPEFASTTTYPDAMVGFWLGIAYKQVRAVQWQDEVDLGAQLFCAHNCVLEAQAIKAAAMGSPPGGVVGPANAKSVDKVSVNYDTTAGTVPGWGNWNMTTFGTRFKYLIDLFGAGPIQVGAGCGYGYGYPYV